ncbi:hypothetical protein [Oceanobacillus timonensis]|uniref:hypothetical protein n=1 Tax=Oceanobacillus timonensis TaxID=1926285 RepID=UPI0009BB8A41|nr:hypothetical protein [Oceanobacillus timonensis]
MKKYMISIILILICSVTLIACNDDEDTADNQTNNDQENMEENNEDAQNANGDETNDNQDNINENDSNSEEADEDTSNNPSDSNNDSETDGDTEVKEDTEAGDEDAYESYENGRFGFSVEYPSTFEADYMPENNDGIEVNDDTATIIASGSHASMTEEGSAFVNEVESIEPYYEGDLAEAEEEGGSISYQRQEDNWYVVSYHDGTNHIYKKSILGDDYIANLVIEYPADLQEEYEPMVERVSDTFSIP